MQENNTSGTQPAGNLIRRLDPRTKLALLLLSFVMALLPQGPAVVALAAALVLAHLTLARAWLALKPVRWLLAPLALFSLGVWSWMAQGPSHLFWRVSQESLAFAAANFLKLATMMAAGLILLATTPAEELFAGSPGIGLGAGYAFGEDPPPSASTGAHLPVDPAPQPDHGLGPGGPGFSTEPAPHLPFGDSDAAPGLAGPGRGAGDAGRIH
jgi:hypothetical protein